VGPRRHDDNTVALATAHELRADDRVGIVTADHCFFLAVRPQVERQEERRRSRTGLRLRRRDSCDDELVSHF
jgi:hypothetical protein